MSDEDLKTIKKTKKVFFSQMTFNNPLQPISATTDIHEAICLQSCESCGVENDIETMSMDSGSNWFCEKCWEELEPVMQSEYEEMKAKGEIEWWKNTLNINLSSAFCKYTFRCSVYKTIRNE